MMAIRPHLFLCNGAILARSAPREWKTAATEALSTGDDGQNVRIEIPQLAKRLGANVRPVFADLTEIAAFVYAGDQAVVRSGNKKFDYGDKWIRQFRYEIAVRCPDFWNQSEVIDCLVESLGFLTEDTYEFRFCRNPNPTPFDRFLGFGDTNPEGIERVVLFSGGLDSLAGAVENIFEAKRRVALVSHKPVNHLGTLQKRLVAKIAERATAVKSVPAHYTVLANKIGQHEGDYTQRSRSFLFGSIASTIAQILGLEQIEFYENGVISVNLPLCDQETNARASRTTHPQAIHRLSQLLTLVNGKAFDVTNHYLSLTKQDVVQRLKDLGHADLVKDSVSCSHTRLITLEQPHCGLCSQCLSRRIATLGAGMASDDPESAYRANALLAPRPKTSDRTLAERFVGVARQIESMSGAAEFHGEFANDLGRVTPYMDGSNRDAVAQLFDLHHRHSVQVGRVVLGSMHANLSDYRDHRLNDTCTLWFAFHLAKPAANAHGVENNSQTAHGSDEHCSIEEIARLLKRLNEMQLRVVGVLREKNVVDPDFDDLPSQKTLAAWTNYEFDTTFKTALSALVKTGCVNNGRHFGRRGGYVLSGRGILVADSISPGNGHD